MIGIPAILNTKEDVLNAAAYAAARDAATKRELTERIKGIRDRRTTLALKDGVLKAPEDQTQDDFEEIADPAAAIYRMGFSEEELNGLIVKLGGSI